MKRLGDIDDYPVAKLKVHPKNDKRHDIEELRRLVREVGQHRTIVVRQATGEVLAGNGWFEATQLEGQGTIAVTMVECSDDEALVIVKSDNRSQDRGGGYDPLREADLLKDLQAAGNLEMAGVDMDYLDDLLAQLNALPEIAATPFEGQYSETDEQIQARTPEQPLGPLNPLRQVMLTFPDVDSFQSFQANINYLRGRFDLDSPSMTPIVIEAVARQALTETPIEA